MNTCRKSCCDGGENVGVKQIVFTGLNRAELLDMPVPELMEGEVRIRTAYSAVSTGTERANITGDVTMPGMRGKQPDHVFPRYLGYSETGVVEAIGPGVNSIRPGDRVLSFWGAHRQIQVLPERQVVRIPDNVSLLDAAFVFIAAFPLAAIRKVSVEIGESAMVVGLGILGQIAIKLLRAAGAVPVIAVDRDAARRELALQLGADAAFDSGESNFEQKVRSITDGKGASVMIEVTGNGLALNQGLRCMAKMGRVALLGCTRRPTEVDFYYDVHLPGVALYGAHTFARPEIESYPGHWTHRDDCAALLRLISAGRLDLHSLITEVHSPEDAPEVYRRLVFEPDFPVGVAFDWSRLS